MATITRYIYSHYDAKDREALEIATGQVPTRVEEASQDVEEDPWQTESAFGAQRRLAAAPRFVPAEVSYDEVNNILGGFVHPAQPSHAEEPKSNVGGWYRSLPRQNTQPIASSSHSPLRASTAPALSSASSSPPTQQPAVRPRPNKNDWFIARALRSQPISTSFTPPPTLADILEREPPKSNQPVKPPVFLALGPTNKGWTMLQQSGWTEGEGLGARWARRPTPKEPPSKEPERPRSSRTSIKTETQEVQLDADGDIAEMRQVEIVDLTLSDSENEAHQDEHIDVDDLADSVGAGEEPISPSPEDSHSTSLLTPIATVLKSDRLGIGLKAKTRGPYKESKKRVTHNQAALAAHIRANEDLRRMKAKVGRGTRGFSRLAKAESEQRRQLLADLKG